MDISGDVRRGERIIKVYLPAGFGSRRRFVFVNKRDSASAGIILKVCPLDSGSPWLNAWLAAFLENFLNRVNLLLLYRCSKAWYAIKGEKISLLKCIKAMHETFSEKPEGHRSIGDPLMHVYTHDRTTTFLCRSRIPRGGAFAPLVQAPDLPHLLSWLFVFPFCLCLRKIRVSNRSGPVRSYLWFSASCHALVESD